VRHRLHRTFAEGAGNGLLLRQLTAPHEKIRLTRDREYGAPNWLRYSIGEHSRVLSGLERRNATIGIAEMTYHIRSVSMGTSVRGDGRTDDANCRERRVARGSKDPR
jgi:DNA-binding GntR family transcriptional regulator